MRHTIYFSVYLLVMVLTFTSCEDRVEEVVLDVPMAKDYTLYQQYIDGRYSIYGRWAFVDHRDGWLGVYVPDFDFLELSRTRQFQFIRNDSVIISGTYENREFFAGIWPTIEFIFDETDLSKTTAFLQQYKTQYLTIERDEDIISFSDLGFDGCVRTFGKVK